MDRKISGILFDVGGVLVTLDGVPSLAKLLNLEASHAAIHARWMTSPSVVSHESGRISAAEFAAGVVTDLNLPVSPESFLQDFCCWPSAVCPGAVELIKEIPRTYRVGILSNTSAVHWERIVAMGLADCFEFIYLSHETGCLKPAPEAFLVALKGMGLPAAEVLFLDDGAWNVDAARSLGMHAAVVRNPQDARAVLQEFGVLGVD